MVRRTVTRTRPRGAAKTARASVTVRRPAVVGASVPRLEGHDKVTGRAQYLDDLDVHGVLHGRTVRSTVARGRITKIECDPAFDWSGVIVADHHDPAGRSESRH